MLSHRHRIAFHKLHRPNGPLSYGIKIIAWERAIRWVGWGFGEALIPIFIFSFSSSFAEAGLMRSTVEIVSLLSLPIIGVWADRMSAKKLILISLILYPLVGISYFLAGALGMAIFIVLARGVNGFVWELENIGIGTYYRRMADRARVSTSFGYIDTWSICAWIIAALAGMALVGRVPIHWLLLAIAPAALVAFFFARRAPSDIASSKMLEPKTSFIHSYATAMREWQTWDTNLWLLGTLTFFTGIVGALMWFFIPIDAYIEGANLPMVILLAITGAIPSLFGYMLGKIADVRNKYLLIAGGLVGIAAIAFGLAIFPHYIFKLVASLLLGVILELFEVAQSSLITTLGSPETFGRRGSAFESISTLGSLVAPLILGIGLDSLGFNQVAIVIAVIALVLGLAYTRVKSTV